MQLAKNYNRFVELDTEVVAVGPDDKAAFEAFFTAQRIPFPGVPDPEHAILEAYGQEWYWWRLGRMPAQFVIDRKGVVRFADYGRSMRDITPVDSLIQLIEKMEREG